MIYKKLTFILIAVFFSLLPLTNVDAQYTGNCIAGTINNTANQCLVNNGNGLLTVNFCDGNETSGPCRPERINGVAAALAASDKSESTGQSCVAQMVPSPGVDPNTGLGYYYNISCGNDSGSTSGSGGNLGGNTGNQTVSSQQTYVNSLMNILNSLITASKTVQNNTGRSIGNTAILPPLFVSPTTSIPSPNTGNRLGQSCYVFTKIIQFGDSGADVTALTSALKKEGFLSQISSVFDTNVMTAVSRLQEAHGTEILFPLGLAQGTGIVGSKTIAYLNSICVVVSTASNTGTTGGGTSGGSTCTQPVRTGILNGKYQYTFHQNSNNTWTITLNNLAFGASSDPYYVKAGYSFIAKDKADLNRQNQGTFNYLQSLPGTAIGNTEYANLFGSFNNAYYDWDNMTKGLPASCNSTAPSTSGGGTSIPVPIPGKPLINLLSPSSGSTNMTIVVSGSGFTPTGNKISFGDFGTENNPIYNIPSTNGTTLSFVVPSTNYLSCWSSSPPCAAPVSLVQPGVYSVSVSNANGVSNSLHFTVVSPIVSPTQCEYAAPPLGCNYVPGPNYNQNNSCGLVLNCSSLDQP